MVESLFGIGIMFVAPVAFLVAGACFEDRWRAACRVDSLKHLRQIYLISLAAVSGAYLVALSKWLWFDFSATTILACMHFSFMTALCWCAIIALWRIPAGNWPQPGGQRKLPTLGLVIAGVLAFWTFAFSNFDSSITHIWEYRKECAELLAREQFKSFGIVAILVWVGVLALCFTMMRKHGSTLHKPFAPFWRMLIWSYVVFLILAIVYGLDPSKSVSADGHVSILELSLKLHSIAFGMVLFAISLRGILNLFAQANIPASLPESETTDETASPQSSEAPIG